MGVVEDEPRSDSRAASASRPSGAASPSTENTVSETRTAGPRWAPSALRTASGSACATTWVVPRASRQPSISEAWLPASETSREPCGASAVTAARLAAYPVAKTRAASKPQNAASSPSSVVCSSVVPVTRREPVAPAPQTRAASAADRVISGWRARPR